MKSKKLEGDDKYKVEVIQVIINMIRNYRLDSKEIIRK